MGAVGLLISSFWAVFSLESSGRARMVDASLHEEMERLAFGSAQEVPGAADTGGHEPSFSARIREQRGLY